MINKNQKAILKDAIKFRPYVKHTDQAFVFSTWLRNYKHSSYFAKGIRSSIFFPGHQKLLELLFDKPTLKVFIAHPTDDDQTILGYLVAEFHHKAPVIHFIFIKEAFRNMGIATLLLNHAEINPDNFHFTHWTMPMDEIIRKHPNIRYNPYCL